MRITLKNSSAAALPTPKNVHLKLPRFPLLDESELDDLEDDGQEDEALLATGAWDDETD